MDKPKITSIKGEVKSEQELMQDFVEKYQALCEEYQLQIVVNPAFKSMADTGTFNVVLQTSVGKMPSRE